MERHSRVAAPLPEPFLAMNAPKPVDFYEIKQVEDRPLRIVSAFGSAPAVNGARLAS
jgi:hypothetical protein